MRSRFNVIASMLGASALVGCANFNAVKKDFVLTEGASVSIDAKQRAIFSVKQPGGTDGSPPRNVVCAEPSPDALSALAANLGVDLTVAAKSLGVAYGTQEGAASIGLRTQTIQTLRDAMYRLCEGYAGGALDDVGFVRLQRRYQAVMLGLLAIEQLTGATVANQATIGGNGAARLGNSFGQVSALITDTRQKQIVAQDTAKAKAAAVEATKGEVAKAEDDLKKATTAAAGQETAELKAAKEAHAAKNGELATAEAELTKAKQAAALATGDLESLEQLRKEMDRASAVTSASAQLVGATHAAQGPADGEGHKRVAEAVENIVTTIVSHDYSTEGCMDWMLSKAVRDSIAYGEKRDLGMLQLQIAFCTQQRQMTQELTLTKLAQTQELELAKLKRDVEVAAASARTQAQGAAPQSTAPKHVAAPKPAAKPAAKPDAKPAPAAQPAKPAQQVAKPAEAASAAAQPASAVTPPAPPKPLSRFNPVDAAASINDIVERASKEPAKLRKTPEK